MRFNRVFITGDKHGDFRNLPAVCQDLQTTENDLMILLGDTGINYFGANNHKDITRKKLISEQPITLLCIRGNHEMRPEDVGTYKLIDKGLRDKVYVDEEYPNIWFAQDGGVYSINNETYLAIGGAYSVDKEYRKLMHWTWFENEQLSLLERMEIFHNITMDGRKFDHIITHAAPLSQQPKHLFMSSIDQSKVDKTTEEFLQAVADNTLFSNWWFGHYHSDESWPDGDHRQYHLMYHMVYQIDNKNCIFPVVRWDT